MPLALRTQSLNHWTAEEVILFKIDLSVAALEPHCSGLLWLPRVGAALRWGLLASPCGGSSCGRWIPGLQASVEAACGPSSSGSVVVLPHSSTACGNFLDQGSNPCPLHWQADSYCATKEVPNLFL